MFSKRAITCLVLLGLIALALPVASQAQVAVGISVRIGPPVLPVYVQPPCPEPGYIWTPGYWAYGPDGYYWVPGAWVEPPEVGLLWTPGYWGWGNGFYIWHAGYWGPHVGFYGGINYGFGYTGVGFVGGFWEGGVFRYNRAVTNVNVTVIHNTYINNTVINNRNISRVSYNGGAGGIRAVPNAQERQWEHERHFEATGTQNHHMEMARGNRAQLYSMNHGRPDIAASPKAGVYEGHGVVAARNTNFNRGGNNNNGGNFNRGNSNGNFNRGANNNSNGNFNRGNNSWQRGNNNNAKVYNNGPKVYNNGPQGNNRNYDRRVQNDAYSNGPHGGNPNAGNPRYSSNTNAHTNYGQNSGGRGNQGGKESHGDKGGDKHDRR